MIYESFCKYMPTLFRLALIRYPETYRICFNCHNSDIIAMHVYFFSFFKIAISYNEIIPDIFGPDNMHTLI